MRDQPRRDLVAQLRAHLAEPFPESVERGEVYGEADAVMIDADIFGWALRASQGESLPALDRTRLQQAADELARSLPAFPVEARPYYERLLGIAQLVLDR